MTVGNHLTQTCRTADRHEITIGPFGHVPTAVSSMIEDEITLILPDGDGKFGGDGARFTRATGRPIWRNLTEIPQ